MNFENQPPKNAEKAGVKKGFSEKLGRASRFCGIFLLGALMEFASTVEAQNLGNKDFSGKREKTENNILYRSPRAENELKQYERLYPSFKESKSPIVVGSFEEELEKFSDADRTLFEIRFRNVGAMTFPGRFIPEEMQQKWHMGGDTIYIMYGTGLDKVPLNRRISIPYHEGSHAKHFAEQFQKNPSDTTGYLRYPELSLETNMYLEELIAGFNTIQWLEEQSGTGDGSVFTEEEKRGLPQALEKERGYFLDNYSGYYRSRHGDKVEIPAGEFQQSDPIDSEVEKMFLSGGIIETLKARAEEMRRGEK